jgi:hypothetical protein
MSPILRLILYIVLSYYIYKLHKFGQRIGFSTQNNTILCNQVRTKILSALKWETLTFKRSPIAVTVQLIHYLLNVCFSFLRIHLIYFFCIRDLQNKYNLRTFLGKCKFHCTCQRFFLFLLLVHINIYLPTIYIISFKMGDIDI